MTVQGTCTPAFELVRSALTKLIDSRDDVGASAAVVLHGELVADVWGGHIDAARTQPWTRDTIINVFSTTALARSGSHGLARGSSAPWPDWASTSGAWTFTMRESH